MLTSLTSEWPYGRPCKMQKPILSAPSSVPASLDRAPTSYFCWASLISVREDGRSAEQQEPRTAACGEGTSRIPLEIVSGIMLCSSFLYWTLTLNYWCCSTGSVWTRSLNNWTPMTERHGLWKWWTAFLQGSVSISPLPTLLTETCFQSSCTQLLSSLRR